jgi:hypothetical protein
VNSLVFFTVLILVLLANLYVLRAPAIALAWHYAGLVLFLSVSVWVPPEGFPGEGILRRYDSSSPDHAFGSNIAGSVVGGLTAPPVDAAGLSSLAAVGDGLLPTCPCGLRPFEAE